MRTTVEIDIGLTTTSYLQPTPQLANVFDIFLVMLDIKDCKVPDHRFLDYKKEINFREMVLAS